MLRALRSFAITPRREIKEFFTTVTVQQLAVGAIAIFEPIYLYQQGLSPTGIVLFNVAVYVPYFFLLPLGGKFAKRFGYEHTLFFSTFFNIAYYLALAAIPLNHAFLFVAPLLLCLQKTFWWPAFHADFARFSFKREAGREIGLLQTLYTISSALGPFIGGVILLFGNFTMLFIFVVALSLISVIPMFSTPERFIPSKLGWLEQMKYIFSRHYRYRLLGSIGFGEEFLAFTLWPLFIYLTLGNAFDVGVVVAIATTVTVVVTMLIGRLTDKTSRARLVDAAALALLLSWVVRPFGFVHNFYGLLATDTAGRASKNALLVPWYAVVYEDAKKNHVMIEVVASEAALVLGKIACMGALLILFQFTDSLPISFALGAIFSVFYFFFR